MWPRSELFRKRDRNLAVLVGCMWSKNLKPAMSRLWIPSRKANESLLLKGNVTTSDFIRSCMSRISLKPANLRAKLWWRPAINWCKTRRRHVTLTARPILHLLRDVRDHQDHLILSPIAFTWHVRNRPSLAAHWRNARSTKWQHTAASIASQPIGLSTDVFVVNSKTLLRTLICFLGWRRALILIKLVHYTNYSWFYALFSAWSDIFGLSFEVTLFIYLFDDLDSLNSNFPVWFGQLGFDHWISFLLVIAF